MKHVKENDLAHGKFMQWYEDNGMTKDFVSKAIRISEELADFETSRNIGMEALNIIATLPPEQRQVPHLTSKGEQKTPDEMTVRELRELKRQLREAEIPYRQANRFMRVFDELDDGKYATSHNIGIETQVRFN